jgi:hypothetical protein
MRKSKGEPKPAQMHDAGDRIVMDISIEEAMTLRVIMGRISGCPNKSPRKHCDTLLEELEKCGIIHDYKDSPKITKDSGAGIYFKDVDIKDFVRWKPK